MNNLTREQAIEQVGLGAIEKVESENVDFTNLVTDGTRFNGYTIFGASIETKDIDGEDCVLTMYVPVDTDLVNSVEQLDELDWDSLITNNAEYRIS